MAKSNNGYSKAYKCSQSQYNDLTLYKSESLAVTKIPKEINASKFKMNLEHM